jgi:putative oxidoreductase
MAFLGRLLATNAPAVTILIRFIVGGVFFSEGVQKFLFPDELGVGRFAKIGFSSPEFTSAFVGIFEIVCGTLILLGLSTRFAAVPLSVVMLVSISTTKAPIMVKSGFWAMAHEARTDYAMLLGSIFLIVVGAGPWSLDAIAFRKART